ncbi:MAG: LysR family transcriptional regulator [Devosia sp.]|nr:LysR family transcriptional regulator [Devosia sp.]
MAIPFTLRQLEYFLAVAEFGSVTAAATNRNVSQPSVSVAVADLEAVIGQRLFQRQAGHRLTISPAGRRLLVQARTILAAAGEIVGPNATPDGRHQLSVACFRDIGPMYLPRLHGWPLRGCGHL